MYELVTLVCVVALVLTSSFLAYRYGLRESARRERPEPGLGLPDLDLEKARREKEYAYFERNMVVALYVKTLQRLGQAGKGGPFRIGVNATPGFGRWSRCVYIDTPEIGQISWHFHDSHAWMLKSLKLLEYRASWDGRDKHQKYAAISAFLESSTK